MSFESNIYSNWSRLICVCFYVLYVFLKQLMITSLYIIFTVNFNNIQAISWGHKVSDVVKQCNIYD